VIQPLLLKTGGLNSEATDLHRRL